MVEYIGLYFGIYLYIESSGTNGVDGVEILIFLFILPFIKFTLARLLVE
jgi:hypothetical protein